ncbi:serine hydrolase domain-containing protein [Actinoplanes sp. NPDC051470]|uniref:serine hydrolase domain-containing protein n=1 Tax=Actinoplanes sp. NPDC051470 TaxID=3157224 RepID=UPI00343195E3
MRTSTKIAAVIAAATAVTAVSVPVASPAGATPTRDARAVLQRDADAMLRYGAPGVLAEVDTPHGDIRVRSGYGNVEAGTPVPWDAKFRIASFTKTFVATTTLQLVGERKLALDDTVDKWLPGVVRGNGNDGRRITVRQLLQHTSGLPDYLGGIPELFTEEGFQRLRYQTLTPQRAVALAVSQPSEFQPGTDWNYSNTNYVLAGLIIEKVTGQPWQHEVQQRIIKPLHLTHTYTPVTRRTIPAPHATGYERFPGEGATPDDPKYGEPVDATELNPSYGGAAGEMISTTDDTNRFLRALLGGRLLRPAQLAEMKRTVPATAFQPHWPGVRYGLGLMYTPNDCGGAWSHGGDIMGFMTRNGVTADGSRSVVISINTDSLKPDPGVQLPATDITIPLINHALCG